MLAAGGPGPAAWATYGLWRALGSKAWPRTQGEILTARVDSAADSAYVGLALALVVGLTGAAVALHIIPT